ncbi:hypothetical protein EV361DRAFT_343713 [Lentinula raphanica]|nr:hypothetical protein EV361DRAFT_343713 [Lentinula raphanica]
MRVTGKYYWLTVIEYLCLVLGSITIVLSAGILTKSVGLISIGLVVSGLGNGGGITTSLISLISNAGQKDQAIATAVSYLFRSLGSVVGLSIGSTILQDVLRSILRERLTGQDIDEVVRRVRESLEYLTELDQSTRTIVLGAYEVAIRRSMWFSFSMGICALVASLFINEIHTGPRVSRGRFHRS